MNGMSNHRLLSKALSNGDLNQVKALLEKEPSLSSYDTHHLTVGAISFFHRLAGQEVALAQEWLAVAWAALLLPDQDQGFAPSRNESMLTAIIRLLAFLEVDPEHQTAWWERLAAHISQALPFAPEQYEDSPQLRGQYGHLVVELQALLPMRNQAPESLRSWLDLAATA